MGHGQDGPNLMGQNRGNNEDPMIGVSWPHQNLLIPFSGSPLPSRANPDSSLASMAFWELAYLSISPNPTQPSHAILFPSVMPMHHASRPLHMLFPLPGMLHTHTCSHMLFQEAFPKPSGLGATFMTVLLSSQLLLLGLAPHWTQPLGGQRPYLVHHGSPPVPRRNILGKDVLYQ